jgi:signal transduction histidine kinase
MTGPEILVHELRQPLTAILSNAQAAHRMLAAGSPDLREVQEILGDIIACDKRAAGVLGRLEDMLKTVGPKARVGHGE